MPAVEIDAFGRFHYVLIKLSNHLDARKLLVRGKNHCSESQLVQLVKQEVGPLRNGRSFLQLFGAVNGH
jgi:Janus/Ocnus family (Ocnus)